MFYNPFLVPLRPNIYIENSMNRLIFWIMMSVSALAFLCSCGLGGESKDDGRAYLVKGTVSLDSAWVANGKLVLFSDNHRSLQQDTIELSKDRMFEFEGHTNGIDELYLCGEKGELCRFYVSGDMEVNLSVIATEAEGVKVKFLGEQRDSINNWLAEKASLFEGQSASICRLLMDSLIKEAPSDIRVTLLLRDKMPQIEDSLYIRQCLGSLKDEAKPDWMKMSIDQKLNVMGSGKKINLSRRLLAPVFEMKDTTIDLSATRSDYMLVVLWADYSKPSIDTLRAYANLIASEYDHKRVSFLSCCLHAEDSAMFRIRTNFLDGNHTWVKGGFSDMRMRAWNIQEVPSVILMDMYCNQMQKNVWGADLRKALDRIPNRVGYQKK